MNLSTEWRKGRLFAYTTVHSNLHAVYAGNKLCCCASACGCAPGLLFVLFCVLLLISGLQVLVIFYGRDVGSADYLSLDHVDYYHGPGPRRPLGGFNYFRNPQRVDQSGQAIQINLRTLLSRHVPSIEENFNALKSFIGANVINSILDKEENFSSFFLSNNSLSFLPQENHTNNRKVDLLIDSSDRSGLPNCDKSSLQLEGHLPSKMPNDLREKIVESQNPQVTKGGKWKPNQCRALHHVAIVIPYRDRLPHLLVLLANLHPILQRQQISYRIFVVEQAGNATFNKGRIMNVAFLEILKIDESFGCFIFHDVDLVPEDDRNMYSCPPNPRHMSPAIDEMGYKIPYDELVGGVLAIKTDHFVKANGYSNLYWGWGAEDDDFAYRLRHVGLPVLRPPNQIGRYKMIKHEKRKAADVNIRYRLLYNAVRRFKLDGLNSLSNLRCFAVSIISYPLYTHILVNIGDATPGY